MTFYGSPFSHIFSFLFSFSFCLPSCFLLFRRISLGSAPPCLSSVLSQRISTAHEYTSLDACCWCNFWMPIDSVGFLPSLCTTAVTLRSTCQSISFVTGASLTADSEHSAPFKYRGGSALHANLTTVSVTTYLLTLLFPAFVRLYSWTFMYLHTLKKAGPRPRRR